MSDYCDICKREFGVELDEENKTLQAKNEVLRVALRNVSNYCETLDCARAIADEALRANEQKAP